MCRHLSCLLFVFLVRFEGDLLFVVWRGSGRMISGFQMGNGWLKSLAVVKVCGWECLLSEMSLCTG